MLLLGLRMLVKVTFGSEKKYVKVSHCDLKLSDFLDEGNCTFWWHLQNKKSESRGSEAAEFGCFSAQITEFSKQ